MENEVLSVSELNAFINQTLQFAYPLVVVQGEVSSYKVNQGKWVFFDLKDDESTISCFMPIFQLKVALEDGMVVRAACMPNLTKWGKFSLTVRSVELAGEGSVKKAFELLKARFEAEGLFAPDRKRPLPRYASRIALVTSAQAAAYNDFVTIVEDRWAGLELTQAQVQVQGVDAPRQIVSAIEYFSRRAEDFDILVVIRGGGSAEDLQAFNSEDVVRAVYGAKLPTVVGIGHEDDVSLAELAADLRAATPTDAARLVTADKQAVARQVDSSMDAMYSLVQSLLKSQERIIERVSQGFERMYSGLSTRLDRNVVRLDRGIAELLTRAVQQLGYQSKALSSLDPRAILSRGYSIATVDGRVLKDSSLAGAGDEVVLQLHKGKLSLRRSDDQSRQTSLGL